MIISSSGKQTKQELIWEKKKIPSLIKKIDVGKRRYIGWISLSIFKEHPEGGTVISHETCRNRAKGVTQVRLKEIKKKNILSTKDKTL